MALQYAVGLVIGGAITVGIALVVARLLPPGTFIGLLGLAAAITVGGGLINDVRSITSLLAVRHSGGFEGSRAPGWWCLTGTVLGAIVAIAIIRGDEGEPSAARASTPRFLALSGLVVSLAATAPSHFGGFGDNTKNALVLSASIGITAGLAAIAFATRSDQPESPSYVAFTTTVGAALLSLLVAAINSPSRLGPLLLGIAVVPMLVGGLVAISGMLRAIAEGSGRQIVIVTSAGLGVLIVVQMFVAVIVGDAAFFAALFGTGFGGQFTAFVAG